MSQGKLLIVEDEPDLIRSLEYTFREAGFEVSSVTRGRDALAMVAARSPDLILLDVMLPDVQGTEICRQLKSDPKTSAIPIIMVTARTDEIDRVVGFELGADDYVGKPFSVRELVLRVKAVLRRGEPTQPNPVLEVGPLVIDQAAHRVWADGNEITLTAREFRLLVTLAVRQGRVLTRETLLSDVWGLSIYVETRTVDTHIKRLREKLGPAGSVIQTVRGVGYRLQLGDAETDTA